MIWAPIRSEPGFLASDMGDIKSPSGKILKQRYHNNQLRVRIRGKDRTVWKLILEAFAGGPMRGYRPRHLNGDLFDNRYENLVYAGSPRTEALPPQVEHCRMGHELAGENVRTWGFRGKNRICVRCNGQRT